MDQTVADEYKSSLSDLNFNSKPLINMLTMLADENKKHAATIVKTIVNHVNSVSNIRFSKHLWQVNKSCNFLILFSNFSYLLSL